MNNQIFQKRFLINQLFVLIGIIILVSANITCSAQTQNTSETYKAYIKKADLALEALEYDKAMELYDKAHQAKPEYNYPVHKMEEIKKNIEGRADTIAKSASKTTNSNAIYKLLLAKGNFSYEIMDYGTALLFYDKAAKTKPEYSYAPAKIEEISTLLNASPESKTRIFENTLRKADSLNEKANFPLAKTEYEKAALIDTAAQLPRERLQQISMVYVDPDDMGNFKLAIANGDKALANSDYDHAILFYETALQMHPKAKYLSQKITDTKIEQTAYKAKNVEPAKTVAKVDLAIQLAVPDKSALQAETQQGTKSIENQVQTVQSKYDTTLASAENLLQAGNLEAALVKFKSASTLLPSEKSTQLKIAEVEKTIAEKSLQKQTDEKYAAAIASGDQLLVAAKYTEALNAYKQALSIKPLETYPAGKTVEINSLLASQKLASDNYAQAVRMGEKALEAGNYSLALTSFQNAEKIKPAETYPKQQIIEIKSKLAAGHANDEKYANAINTADQFLNNKEYHEALTAYSEAVKLKQNEKYPQDQIARINKIIVGSHPDDKYTLAITEGEKLVQVKDYTGAVTAFNNAATLKPNEAYPAQRILEINKIIADNRQAHSTEYNKAIELADKLYNSKIYDQAIEAYESAAKIDQGDAYAELQISKIRKYMLDHSILELNSKELTISRGSEKKFTFPVIDPSLRKNNYILIKARSTSNIIPKVYLSYGKDNSKNGGIVMRNFDKTTLSDYLISISIQDKWFREENNWLSISVETGEIEISRVQISAGE